MIACNLYGLAARVCILFLVLAGPAAFAQAPSIPSEEQRAAEARAAWTAGLAAATKGPATVSLGSQGSFQVPAQLVFIPVEEAARILRAMGNSAPGASFLGLVTHPRSGETWIATISFRKEGYIKDDDAEVWNADELLDQLKTGTEQGNKDRRARGFREIEVVGWIEKPAYERATHRLVWSAGVKGKGAPDGEGRTANYNTYLLGREGYFSLNFVTDASSIEGQKPLAKSLLAAISFDIGQRYEDFSPSTDRVAAYGLAALVGGAVLKKAGFFAILAAFAAKFAKVGLVVVAGLIGAAAKLFRRKSPPKGRET